MLSKQLNLSLDDLGGAIHALLKDPKQLFMSDYSRTYLASSRLAAARKEGLISTMQESTDSVENTIRHNLESLDPSIAGRRPYEILGPLLGIDSVQFRIHELDVLIIGPRTEAELLLYIAHGFNQDRILGLDLISYSDYVVQGDMHKMPFDSRSFDIVVFSWVLGYSSNQPQAIDESIRVLREGGLLAIGEQWDPMPVAEISRQMLLDKGYTLEGTPMESAQQMDKLLSAHKTEKLFGTEPQAIHRSRPGWITGIYRLLS